MDCNSVRKKIGGRWLVPLKNIARLVDMLKVLLLNTGKHRRRGGKEDILSNAHYFFNIIFIEAYNYKDKK